jgi:hypothetical protein
LGMRSITDAVKKGAKLELTKRVAVGHTAEQSRAVRGSQEHQSLHFIDLTDDRL